MSTVDKLIHDINQTARYWAAYPHDEAVRGLADHFNKFWEPRIRAKLHEAIRARDARLDRLVFDAAPGMKP
jgi:formate dehydrogenase subunit delta